MSCSRNSDYSASKFALNGFLEALRQELNTDMPQISLTTFHPYYINTGLFAGFKPKLALLIPTLEAGYVIDVMYHAIMSE